MSHSEDSLLKSSDVINDTTQSIDCIVGINQVNASLSSPAEGITTYWYQQIYKNVDGSVFNPLDSNSPSLLVIKSVCCVIGLLASARAIYKTVVTCNEDGGWRPRHVLLIATIVSCILSLLVHCLIPAVYFFFPSDDLCRLFVLVYCLPYISFLFNILLALIDRYVTVTRSTWHRNKFNDVRLYSVALPLLNLLLVVANDWPFIAQIISIDCEFNFLHGLGLVLSVLIITVLCTGFLIAVFVATWHQLPQAARAIPIPTVATIQSTLITDQQQSQPPAAPIINPAEIEYVALKDLLPAVNFEITVQPPPPVVEEASTSVTSSSSSYLLCKLELEVTKRLLFTLLPLFLIVVPGLVFGLSYLVYFYNSIPQQEQDPAADLPEVSVAASLVQYIPYSEMAIVLHVLVYLTANLLLNDDIFYCCSFSIVVPSSSCPDILSTPFTCCSCFDSHKNNQQTINNDHLYL